MILNTQHQLGKIRITKETYVWGLYEDVPRRLTDNGGLTLV